MNVRNIHRLLVTEAPSWLIYVFFFYVYTSLDFFSSTSQIQKIAPTMEFSCKRMHTKLPFSFFFFFSSWWILLLCCSFLLHSIFVLFILGPFHFSVVHSWCHLFLNRSFLAQYVSFVSVAISYLSSVCVWWLACVSSCNGTPAVQYCWSYTLVFLLSQMNPS